MTPRTGTLRNLGYSTLSAATNGLLLVLVVLATRRLGPDGYAVFSYAFVLAKIGEALMDFGLQQATIRGVARDRSTARAVFTNSISMKALSGVAVAILLPIVPLVQWPAAFWPSVLMLAGSLLRSYVMTIRGVLQGLEQFAHDAAIEFADRALMLAFGAAALGLGYGVVGVCTGCLVARVVSLVWALAVARRHVGAPSPAFDYALWRDLGHLAAPIGAFLMVITIYAYVDVLILEALRPDARELARYVNAYRLYEALTYASGVLAAVLTPQFAGAWARDPARHRRLARRSAAGAAVLGVAMAAVAWRLSGWGLEFLFGVDYRPAATSLHILLLGLPLVFTIWILHALALSVFNQRLLLQATIAGAIVNVATNLAAIPSLGRDGAALATVAGEAVAMAMLVWGLRRVFQPESVPTAQL
jgi:O-antigen/teichoic acid export membrane protein